MNDQFIGKICVIRANGAGVFMGEIIKQDGDTVLVKDARRLWYWDGANSLSELAEIGTSKPSSCKFPVVVGEVMIFRVLEIIKATDQAINSIKGVPTWKKS